LYNKQFGHAVEEQGARMKPVEAPKPAVEEDDEDAPVESPKIFQTLIGHALPAPATPKAFQTLMTQGVAPPPQRLPVAQPAKPAAAPAPAQSAPAAKPAVPPPAPAPKPAIQAEPQSPAQHQPKPVTPAQPARDTYAVKPKPAIFETTIMRTIPEASATPPSERTAQKPSDGATSGESSLADLTYTNEMRAIQAEQRAHSAPTATSGRSGLRGERLDMLNSPVIQHELPGLRAAFDTAAMRLHIQSLFFGRARPNYAVEYCEVEQATYLPGEGVAIRYETRIKDRGSGQTLAPIVVGMVFPSQLACALYMRDKLAPLVELMRDRAEIAAFATPAAIVEPLNMALHVFPIDGELPALVAASNPRHMRAVLSETLPQVIDSTFVIEKCEVELVDYARRHRAVLRYHLEGRRPGGSRVERQTVYGKVFTNNVGALAGSITSALRERVLHNRGDYTFDVPRALGWRPDLHLSLLEAIPGKPILSEVLKARFKGQATEPEVTSLREMVDACAKIAATLHTSNIKLGRRRTLDDEVASLRAGFADVRRISPDLGAQLEAWLEQISAYAEQSDSLNLSFCHGDYTYTQVIFEGRQAGLVDFDSVCQAEPALDLGHFLAYLKVAGFKAQKVAGSDSRALVGELSDRFMSTYLAAMGGRMQDAERLRVRVAIYQIVSLLRRALRSWQKFKGSRLESALALIEEEIAYLPQLDY
jgi:thiamine kinase-like enzyme